MNFSDFFDDVKQWMSSCNTQATELGFNSLAFWEWVYNTSGQLAVKYNNHVFALRQMQLIVRWLEEQNKGA